MIERFKLLLYDDMLAFDQEKYSSITQPIKAS